MADAVFTLMVPDVIVVKISASPGTAGSLSVAGVPLYNSGVTPRIKQQFFDPIQRPILRAIGRRKALVIVALRAIQPGQVVFVDPIQDRIDNDIAIRRLDTQQTKQALELYVRCDIDRHL